MNFPSTVNVLKPTLVTGPAAPMLTLAQAKAHLRVLDTDQDAYISSLLPVVEAMMDGYTGDLGHCLVNQTWSQKMDFWPARVDLPLRPVSAISIIKYYDTQNALQTWASTNYGLYEDALGPFIQYPFNVQPPNLYPFRPDAIEIQFVAGYGPDATTIPAPIVQAALLWLADMFENRETMTDVVITPIPKAAERLISRYYRVGI